MKEKGKDDARIEDSSAGSEGLVSLKARRSNNAA
jgi:hypothetical protein